MIFFLHTSFTIEKRSAGSRPYRYYDHLALLEYYALGNIKTLAKKVTLDVAMLDYLSNDQNDKGAPNENYAREFMELFTIMKGPQIGPEDYTNYTEKDVQVAARLLTGYGIDKGRETFDADTGLRCGKMVPKKHDSDDKTFSAAFDSQTITGRNTEEGMAQELDDFVEMIFSKQETARAYCRKLYRFFIKSKWNDDVERDIIEPLSLELMQNNYEVIPVLKTLLSSAHFYDEDNDDATDEIIGGMIKSPIQLVLEIMSAFKCDVPSAVPPEEGGDLEECFNWNFGFAYKFLFRSVYQAVGFNMFDPDSVAGYPAYYQQPGYDQLWFDSSTIIGRYRIIETFLTQEDIIGDGRSGSFIPHADVIKYLDENCTDPSDPNVVIRELTDLLYPESVNNDRITYFKGFLLDDTSKDYYWRDAWFKCKTAMADMTDSEDPEDNADYSVVRSRLDDLVKALINAPEFQTM